MQKTASCARLASSALIQHVRILILREKLLLLFMGQKCLMLRNSRNSYYNNYWTTVYLYLSAPEPCPPGYYSNIGWIQCLPCRRGFRCKEGSTTDSPAEGELTYLVHVITQLAILTSESQRIQRFLLSAVKKPLNTSVERVTHLCNYYA